MVAKCLQNIVKKTAKIVQNFSKYCLFYQIYHQPPIQILTQYLPITQFFYQKLQNFGVLQEIDGIFVAKCFFNFFFGDFVIQWLNFFVIGVDDDKNNTVFV